MSYEEKVDALIQACREMFCLDGWDVYRRILPSDRMPTDGKGDGADGFANIDHKYRVAHISIAEGLDDKRLVHVAVHEMIHVLLSPMSMACSYMVEYIKGPARSREEQGLEIAEEHVCQMLAMGLARLAILQELIDGTESVDESVGKPATPKPNAKNARRPANAVAERRPAANARRLQSLGFAAAD